MNLDLHNLANKPWSIPPEGETSSIYVGDQKFQKAELLTRIQEVMHQKGALNLQDMKASVKIEQNLQEHKIDTVELHKMLLEQSPKLNVSMGGHSREIPLVLLVEKTPFLIDAMADSGEMMAPLQGNEELLKKAQEKVNKSISPSVSREFLEYLESDKEGAVKLNKHNVMGLLDLAVKYNVPKLEESCIQWLENYGDLEEMKKYVKEIQALMPLINIINDTENFISFFKLFAKRYPEAQQWLDSIALSKLNILSKGIAQNTFNAQRLFAMKEKLEETKAENPIELAVKMRGWLQDHTSSFKSLDLSDLNLTNLPKEIKFFTSIESLNLAKNKLTTLPAEIGNLTSLSSLNLHTNQLKSLPAEIGNLTSLRALDLNTNQLKSLPAEIGKLASLAYLTIDHNQLTSLPAEIGKLASLTYLTIDHNQLTSLPAEIGKLASLAHLSIDHNQLTNLPKEIGNLTSLRYLYLEYNQLPSIPAEIGKLASLTHFHIHHNQLKKLPEEIGNLTSLRYLFLKNNQLTSLPATIVNLTSLEMLGLAFNPLTNLPATIGRLRSSQLEPFTYGLL